MTIRFENTYTQLPQQAFSRVQPTPVASPQLIIANQPLAERLGISEQWLSSDAATAVFAGNSITEGSDPIATVYAGYQFGQWNPQLGDGRAILLGETIGEDGKHYDIQLKGAGRTPYSRGGDGRSPLGPVIREYLVSEAMAVLGVPTTRALAAVTTGETVFRQQPLMGGILTRVAASHIRIGTIQYFAAQDDVDTLRTLLAYVIQRHYPALEPLLKDDPQIAYLQLFAVIMQRQAKLIAQWQSLGFIHGVMNTDNCLLSGETIDYGPCAFMDSYQHNMVYSSIDNQGRYAYCNQPAIAHWNLSKLAEALLSFFAKTNADDTDDFQANFQATLQSHLNEFPDQYYQAYYDLMLRKLGLRCSSQDSENPISDELKQLVDELMAGLEQAEADMTLSFRYLSCMHSQNDPTATAELAATAEFYTWPAALQNWFERWQSLTSETANTEADLRNLNPLFIPRNHQVEAAIAAAYQQDFSVFHALNTQLQTPYTCPGQPTAASLALARPPQPDEIVPMTFCGT